VTSADRARGTLRRLRWPTPGTIAAATLVTVILVVWPWAASPFSGPKWVVTGVGAATCVVLLVGGVRRPGPVAFAAIATLAATLLSSLLAHDVTPRWMLAGPLLVVALALLEVPLRWRAVAAAGGLAATVVVLQSLGLDPFARFVPQAEGRRLALYGTLGNPDFVASVLGVTAPLTIVAALRDRLNSSRPALVSAAVQILAVALLRSFATVLALGAAATVALLHPGVGRERRWLALALGAALLVAAVPLTGRSPSSVLRGRWYLISTAAPHIADAPWLGQGPDAVVLHWPAWELERWRGRCGADPACVASHPEGRFTGIQEHLHDDWLERLVETGVVGLAALLALFGTAFTAALRSRSLEGLGIASGLAALAARATVDFPLQRPADLVLLAVLCGAAAGLHRRDFVDARRSTRGSFPDKGRAS
jgi:O-antigen ligase